MAEVSEPVTEPIKQPLLKHIFAAPESVVRWFETGLPEPASGEMSDNLAAGANVNHNHAAGTENSAFLAARPQSSQSTRGMLSGSGDGN
jgi:hypothetical protein